jgi:hypothetical protein
MADKKPIHYDGSGFLQTEMDYESIVIKPDLNEATSVVDLENKPIHYDGAGNSTIR